MNRYIAIAYFCAVFLLAAPASAQNAYEQMYGESSGAPAAHEPAGGGNDAYLSFGIGQWDVADDDDAADFRMEYRSGNKFFWEIKPWVGLEATSDGSVWGGGGLLADLYVSPQIYLTPSFGVGLYGQGSSDKDLGSVIEFRSQLEAGYRFTNGHRVGLAFGHISNASIGDKNPGTNILNVYYHVPVGGWF